MVTKKWAMFGETISTFDVTKELDKNPKKKLFGKGSLIKGERVIMVGKYRIWIYSREYPKLKHQELVEFHIFDVKSMSYDSETRMLKIELRKEPPKNTSLEYLCYEPPQCIESARLSYSKFSYGYPESYITFTQPGLEPLPSEKHSNCSMMIQNYRGVCSYLNVPVYKDLEFYINDLFEVQSIDLDASQVPLIEPLDGSKKIDFAPLFLSLRFDKNFRSLTFCDTPQNSPAVTLIARALSANRHLTKLVLANSGANEQQLINLSHALKTNSKNLIEVLDLSGNQISMKAAGEFSACLSSWNHSLNYLNLANCSMAPKSVEMIFNAFTKNTQMSVSVKYLNMSGSKFELPGSHSMNRWFNSLKAYSELRTLKLSSCSLAIQQLKCFKLLKNIEDLDFSNNRLEQLPGSSVPLCNALELFPRIKRLNFSNCDLSEGVAHSLLSALSKNPGDIAPYLVLSGNSDLKGEWLRDLPALLEGKLSGLDISGLRVRDAVWADLVRGLAGMETVTAARLDDSVSLGKDADAAVQALCALAGSASLRSLSIAGGFGKRVVAAVLAEVAKSATLEKLDVSGNSLGDSGIREVAEMLKENGALRELAIDANHTRLHGFLALATAFSKNETLQRLDCADDANREFAALSAGPQRARLVKALATIHLSLARPEDAAVDFWAPTDERPDVFPTPAEPSPLPQLPESFFEQAAAFEDSESEASEDEDESDEDSDEEGAAAAAAGEEGAAAGGAAAHEGETEEERRQRERERKEKKERERQERKEKKERERKEKKEREKAERAQKAAPPPKPQPVILPTTILKDEDVALFAPSGNPSGTLSRRGKMVPVAPSRAGTQWTVKAGASTAGATPAAGAPPGLKVPPSLAAPPGLELPGSSPKEEPMEDPQQQQQAGHLKGRGSGTLKRSAFARNPRGTATQKSSLARGTTLAAPAAPAAPTLAAPTAARGAGIHHRGRPLSRGAARGAPAGLAKTAPGAGAALGGPRPAAAAARPVPKPAAEEAAENEENEEQEVAPKTPARRPMPKPVEENDEDGEAEQPEKPARPVLAKKSSAGPQMAPRGKMVARGKMVPRGRGAPVRGGAVAAAAAAPKTEGEEEEAAPLPARKAQPAVRGKVVPSGRGAPRGMALMGQQRMARPMPPKKEEEEEEENEENAKPAGKTLPVPKRTAPKLDDSEEEEEEEEEVVEEEEEYEGEGETDSE